MVRVDARGMRCPWPVARLARAIREGATVVAIHADDPIAPAEIAALCAAQGWAIAAVPDASDTWHVAVDARLLPPATPV